MFIEKMDYVLGTFLGTRKKTEEKVESIPSPCLHSMVRGVELLPRETERCKRSGGGTCCKETGTRVVGCVLR